MLACKSIIRNHFSKNTQQYAPGFNTDDVAKKKRPQKQAKQ